MLKLRPSAVLLLIAVVLLSSAGCGLRYFGESTALVTKADERLVVASPAKLETGRNVPRQIFCAEPSPDVAKAVAESFNLSGALDAVVKGRELPAEGALKAAAAISKSRAEALAQLTNRLATIQLLRDSLYRACEAYGNGALSEITYAIILSRFDKLMVTLLTGELVGGNFGQSLAVLGTSASGAASAATVKAAQDAAKAAESQKTVDDARENLEAKRTTQADAIKARNACTDDACRTQKQAEVDTKRNEVAVANDKLVTSLVNAMGDVAAAASSNASVLIAQGVGAVPAGHGTNPQADTTKALETMQKRFLENINADPLVVACLTAFDRDRGAATPSYGRTLVKFCQKEFPMVLHAQGDLLRAKLIDGQTELVQGCMSAFRETNSTDPGVMAAAKTLTAFCEKQLLQILKTQAELTLNEKQLQNARLELERKKTETQLPDPPTK